MATFLDLDAPLMTEVFNHLPTIALVTLSSVCTDLRDVARDHVCRYRNVGPREDITMESFELMTLAYKSMRTFTGHDDSDMHHVALLEKCDLIDDVAFSRCKNMTDEAVDLLAAQHPHLKSVNFDDCRNLSGDALDSVSSSCPSLETVSFAGAGGIDSSSVASLAKCPQLTSVNFIDCTRITDRAVAELAAACKLTNAEFSGCTGLTEEVMTCIWELPSIKTFSFDGISDAIDDMLYNRV